MTNARIKNLPLLCQQLIGIDLGTNQHGHAGRALEDLLEQWGWPINRGAGPDILVFGLEIKTRDEEAVSAQTITSMNIRDILDQDYDQSAVRAKFQQQLRILTCGGRIRDAEVFDFSGDSVQDLIRRAYRHARAQLIQAHEQQQDLVRTAYTGFYGYFERCNPLSATTYSFRLNDADMTVMENLSRTRIDHFYTIS